MPRSIFLLCLYLLVPFALLCGGVSRAEAGTPVVMLSDIHFDPFHNPQLLPRLASEPIEQWPAILNTPGGLHEDADRAALDVACTSRALDTGWLLLVRSLAAAQHAEAHPAFVTVTGDLLAHEFPCRFRHLTPGATAAQLSAFSAKTVAFVAWEVRTAFPDVPVFVTLGNNDSGCADYAETPGSAFLRSTQDTVMAALAQGARADPPWHMHPQTDPLGDYAVAAPPPFHHGRLLVLNDVFDSTLYRACGAADAGHPETVQIAWLRGQLAEARAAHEPVWVLGHIPPGLDVYASFARFLLHPLDLCAAQPRTLLRDDRLADALLDYADVVRLALFAHTHMDEVRVLERKENGKDAVVPVKLVPSITPFAGNHPGFLVATVDPQTMVLQDWRTVVSAAPEGSVPPWTEAYRFTTAYHLPDFSAASALQLAQGFVDDRSGKAERSTVYREHFYPGGVALFALGLEQVWPAYACAVRNTEAEAFHSCLCPAGHTPAQPVP